MKISAPPTTPLASAMEMPIERLAQDSHLSEAEKVTRLSEQFEALLMRQILQNARKPVIHSYFETQSAPESIYDDMVTNQLAESISRSGSLGLAKTLQQQLAHQLLNRKPDPDDSAAVK